MYDVSKLKEDENVRESFKIELKNRFQALSDKENMDNENIEKNGGRFELLSETSDSVLGFKGKNKKDWMTQQTLEKLWNEGMLKRL
jgi:hypothetical protein